LLPSPPASAAGISALPSTAPPRGGQQIPLAAGVVRHCPYSPAQQRFGRGGDRRAASRGSSCSNRASCRAEPLNPWMATASSTELAAGDCTAAPSHTSSISHAPAPLPQAYQGFLISPPTPSGFLACSLCTSHSSSPLPSCWDWDGLGSGDEEGILMCIVGDFFRKMCFLHVSQCMNSAVRDAASLPPSGPCENYKRKRSRLDSELGEASLSRGDGKTCPYARLQNTPLFFATPTRPIRM
jgi:hypothetical protein